LRIGHVEVTWAGHRRQYLLYPAGIARARDLSPSAAGRGSVAVRYRPNSEVVWDSRTAL